MRLSKSKGVESWALETRETRTEPEYGVEPIDNSNKKTVNPQKSANWKSCLNTLYFANIILGLDINVATLLVRSVTHVRN